MTHFKAIIRSGEDTCDDCGWYDWESVTVYHEDGSVFIECSGDSHLSGWSSPWLQMTEENWVEIFKTFGHTIELNIKNMV